MELYEKIDRYKSKIDTLRPFEGDMLTQMKAYYRIGLTWSSNALEGNTLSESETKVLLEDGLTVGGKPLKDTFEALGHAQAYDFMFSLLRKSEVTELDILTMHKLFYSEIDAENAGVYRNTAVIITGSKYPVCKPQKIQEEMSDLIVWIKQCRHNYHPVEFAALLHKKFVFIHPFIDGNGRIARLLMNTVLIQNGYLLAVIPPVLRHEYIALLEMAHIDDKPFVQFIGECVLESEKEMARLLHIDMNK